MLCKEYNVRNIKCKNLNVEFYINNKADNKADKKNFMDIETFLKKQQGNFRG